MRGRRSVLKSSIFIVSLLGSSTALAEGWYAVTSDNFTLYSDAPADETKKLIENFELFRHSTLAVLGLQDQPENHRLVIVAYAHSRDFGRIAPRDAAGFYYDSIFGPRMLLRDVGRDRSTQQTLFHEYVHYVMNQRSTLNYPRWYSEGLATVLMTTEIDDSILVGNPPPSYAFGIELGFRPTVHDVVTVQVDAEDGFYLTSWLMAHYFSLGNPTRREQTTDYLRRYDAGEDPVAAFEASYGATPTAMDAEVAAYARRRTLNALRAPRQQYTGSLSTRALGEDEALLLLADIAVEVDALDAAHHYFDEASKAGADSPYRFNLMGRRAIAYIHERRVSEGDELIGQLLEAGSEDPQVLGDIAHYAFDKYVEIQTGRSAGATAAELDHAIEYGLRATEADPANLEAHYYLGLSYEAAGRLQNAADALLSGYDLGPSPRLNRDLARVLIKGGQHELASYLLSRMLSVSHADEWRNDLRALIDDLEDGEASSASRELLAPSWLATSGAE